MDDKWAPHSQVGNVDYRARRGQAPDLNPRQIKFIIRGLHGYLTSLIHIYICMYTCLSVRMRSTIISFFFINIKNSFDWSQILVLSCQTSDSRKNKNHPRSSLFLPSLLLVLFDRLLGANSVLYGVYIILIELIRYTNLSIIKFTKHNSF